MASIMFFIRSSAKNQDKPVNIRVRFKHKDKEVYGATHLSILQKDWNHEGLSISDKISNSLDHDKRGWYISQLNGLSEYILYCHSKESILTTSWFRDRLEDYKTKDRPIRDVVNISIPKRNEEGMLHANSFLNQCNSCFGKRKTMKDYFRNKPTGEYIDQLMKDKSFPDNSALFVKSKRTGTWMHPYLFIDFAMWINPELKVKILTNRFLTEMHKTSETTQRNPVKQRAPKIEPIKNPKNEYEEFLNSLLNNDDNES